MKLLAYYYSQRLLQYKIGDSKNYFDTLYSNDITYFIKQVVCSGDYTEENRYFNAIKNIYGELLCKAQSQLCYLLGRFKTDEIKSRSIAILQGYKRNLKSQIKKKSGNSQSSQLLLRTIYISLIYLNVISENNEYIELLLEESHMNSYNRGFYLQYYGALEYALTDSSFLQKDDAKQNKAFEKTYKSLSEKINKFINNNNDPLFEINLLTICSIIQVCSQGSALNKKYIKETKSLISQVLDACSISNKKLMIYLIMIKEDLDKGFKPGSLFRWADQLQKIKRAGWVQDKVDDPENVVVHTFSCWLIGFLYLLSSLPSGKEYINYRKNKILDMLLLHDLAEVDTGDIITSKKTDEKKEYEYQRMLVFLMHDT